MENTSEAYRIGQQAGVIVGVILMIALPIAFGTCLSMAFLRAKKTVWIVFSVITGVPVVFFIIAFCYGLYLGTAQHRGKSPTSSTFHPGNGLRGTIKGTNYDYTLEVPDEIRWKVNRQDLNFDAVTFCRDVYVAVSVERINTLSMQEICRQANLHLSKLDPNSTFTTPEPVTIDGASWLHFNAMSTVRGFKVAYSFYVHSGAKGSCRVVGWTGQSLFEQEKATIDQISRSFRFGEGLKELKADALVDAPATPAAAPAIDATATPGTTTPSTPVSPAGPAESTVPSTEAIPAQGESRGNGLS